MEIIYASIGRLLSESDIDGNQQQLCIRKSHDFSVNIHMSQNSCVDYFNSITYILGLDDRHLF
jgi:hypothetical protein